MRVYLMVPFQQKDRAKAKGARWDAAAKSWYVPDGMDAMRFAAWLPREWGQARTSLRRRRVVEPEQRSGEWIVGAEFAASDCDCDIPPWEVCPHSFPEHEYATYDPADEYLMVIREL